jgi:hypothetical protein
MELQLPKLWVPPCSSEPALSAVEEYPVVIVFLELEQSAKGEQALTAALLVRVRHPQQRRLIKVPRE